MTVAAIQPLAAAASADPVLQAAATARPAMGASFAELLSAGVEKVNQDALAADAMVRAFALDDSVPVHQVTYALEQARLSVELMMHVRARLLEGYQELMRMQL
jgi:flagellar hook-basal body complex protein FliE